MTEKQLDKIMDKPLTEADLRIINHEYKKGVEALKKIVDTSSPQV